MYEIIIGNLKIKLSEQQINGLFVDDAVRMIKRVKRQKDGRGMVKLNEYSLKPELRPENQKGN